MKYVILLTGLFMIGCNDERFVDESYDQQETFEAQDPPSFDDHDEVLHESCVMTQTLGEGDLVIQVPVPCEPGLIDRGRPSENPIDDHDEIINDQKEFTFDT